MVTPSSEKIVSFVCGCVVLCDVFLVILVHADLRLLHTQLSLVEKTLIQWDSTQHAPFPVLVIPKPKRKLQLYSPQCLFAIIKSPVTQG